MTLNVAVFVSYLGYLLYIVTSAVRVCKSRVGSK